MPPTHSSHSSHPDPTLQPRSHALPPTHLDRVEPQPRRGGDGLHHAAVSGPSRQLLEALGPQRVQADVHGGQACRGGGGGGGGCNDWYRDV